MDGQAIGLADQIAGILELLATVLGSMAVVGAFILRQLKRYIASIFDDKLNHFLAAAEEPNSDDPDQVKAFRRFLDGFVGLYIVKVMKDRDEQLKQMFVTRAEFDELIRKLSEELPCIKAVGAKDGMG